ncbi:hypothetical protein K8369_21830, partial [Streptomyces sp. PSKA30]
RPEDALTWYERAAEEGDKFAYRCAARMLARVGRTEEARLWYRRAAKEAGDPYALEEARQLDGAVPEEREAATEDGSQAEYFVGGGDDVSWLLAKERGTYASLQEPAFPVGYDDFTRTLWALVLAGRDGGTFGVLDRTYDEPNAHQILRLLREHGLIDQAVAWCQSNAAAGSPHGDWWGTAHLLLKADGRTDEAQRLRRYGWEPDGSVSHPWEALPPETPLQPEALRRHHSASETARKSPASNEGGGPAWWRP